MRLATCALAVALASATSIAPLRAEYMTAPGEVSAATENASALLNSALSHYHLMMAGIDRKNSELAGPEYVRFIDGLFTSSNAYSSAAKNGAERNLSPSPRNAEDKECISYFNAQSASYK